jgi:hypothetical protein
MADCCSQTAIAQEIALPDISVIIHSIFNLSEGNKDGCRSKISTEKENPGRYQDSQNIAPEEASGVLGERDRQYKFTTDRGGKYWVIGVFPVVAGSL